MLSDPDPAEDLAAPLSSLHTGEDSPRGMVGAKRTDGLSQQPRPGEGAQVESFEKPRQDWQPPATCEIRGKDRLKKVDERHTAQQAAGESPCRASHKAEGEPTRARPEETGQDPMLARYLATV